MREFPFLMTFYLPTKLLRSSRFVGLYVWIIIGKVMDEFALPIRARAFAVVTFAVDWWELMFSPSLFLCLEPE